MKKKTLDMKWVFKTKINPNGEIGKYKAKLVARGFLKRAGYDYNNVFPLVARIETIRMIVSIASRKCW